MDPTPSSLLEQLNEAQRLLRVSTAGRALAECHMLLLLIASKAPNATVLSSAREAMAQLEAFRLGEPTFSMLRVIHWQLARLRLELFRLNTRLHALAN